MPEPALATSAPVTIPTGFPRNLPQALVHAVRRHPDEGVVTVDETGGTERLTYPELSDRARRILAGLRDEGVSVAVLPWVPSGWVARTLI